MNGSVRRRRGLRRLSIALLVPVIWSLGGGPTAAQAFAESRRQRQRVEELAARQGLDPRMLLDPAGWARRQQAAADQRRKEALAALPAPRPSPGLAAQIAETERRQALHSMIAAASDLANGRSDTAARLPPPARRLLDDARRSGVRLPARKRAPIRQHELEPLRAASQAPAPEAPELLLAALDEPTAADTAPTLDAPAHPALVAKAQALGNDPVAIYNFVHDTIETELYAGSKKGALGTLREGRGNDHDQASLLVALLRAAGIPARYELGEIELSAAAANEYAASEALSTSLSALVSAGIPAQAVTLGPGRGLGLRVRHAWVRAFVPSTAYRGVRRPGAVDTWVPLAPALKRMRTQPALDLRDAVTFDFGGYLSQPTRERPMEAFERQLRAHIQETGIDCETLDSATKRRTIVADALPTLPDELPAKRVASERVESELPAAARHTVRFVGTSSQGATFTHAAAIPALWGKSVTVVYEPATAADAALIAEHGGLEETPAWAIRLRPVLKIDGVPVASGAAESPGAPQELRIELSSPAGEGRTATHAMTVGGVYAFLLDPGVVPESLVGERTVHAETLSGDDREAERLFVLLLRYFRHNAVARERLAALQWHRLWKDVEEGQAGIEPRLAAFGSTPLRLSRDVFFIDVRELRFGTYSVDGDHRRSPFVAKLSGHESSFLEHVIGEEFRGPNHYSAVKLVQLAGTNVVTFTEASLEDALPLIGWPAEEKQRLRDLAAQGYTVTAPRAPFAAPGVGTLFGAIATAETSGLYEVMFQTQALNGGVGDNGSPDGAPGGCGTCGGGGPGDSAVHLLSGNYYDQVAELSLPARGIPLSFLLTYSAQLGWRVNYDRTITPGPDGARIFTDHEGVRWTFTPAGVSGVWDPPPTKFQRIESLPGGGYAMVFPDGAVHGFDAQGRLGSEADLNGNTITVVRDGAGRTTTVLATGGGALAFGYDPAGRLASVTDSAGRVIRFEHDAAGNLVEYTDVLGKVRTFGYDHLGRMRTKTSFRGHVTAIDYDDLGRVVRMQTPEGGVRRYAYDTRNRRVLYTDRTGATTLSELNEHGLTARQVDPLGNEAVKLHDARGLVVAEQDARGHWTHSTYDPTTGSLLSRTDPLDATTTYTYGPHSRLETVRDALGRVVSSNTYDPQGNLLTSTDGEGHTTSYTYAAGGLVETITRPGNAVTRMTYRADGSVETMTDATGGVTTFGYDAAGHLTSVTDPNGNSRTMVPDARGQILTMRDARSRETHFEFDDDGNRTKVTDPESGQTQFEYDSLGRLVATTDAHGQVVRQAYDAEGRIVSRTDARGFATTMRYDALGRLVATTDPTGATTTVGYCANEAAQPCVIVDPLGNVTTIVEDELGREIERRDPLGNVTKRSYDLLGRLETTTDPDGHTTTFVYDADGRLQSVTDALNGVTEYGYDGRGNRNSVKDANGNVTAFTYDESNRLVSELTPATTTIFEYDLAGNRRFKVDGKNQRTEMVYDPNRRLTEILYASGPGATFEYDDNGHRTLERNGDSERRMHHDAVGRLERVEDVTLGRELVYTYDASGNRTSMKVLPDGDETRYAWDSRGLLQSMTDPEGDVYRFTHDKAGRRTGTLYPNGMTLATTYDQASRALAMVYRKRTGEVIESFRYTYDKRGNRTSKIFADGTAETYGYDALSRLVSATYPSGREVRYTYDAVGNRLEMSDTQDTTTVACPGDRDCDGVPDGLDNCAEVANPTQTDADRGALPADIALGLRFEETEGPLVEDVRRNVRGTLTDVTRGMGKFGRGVRFANAAVETPSFGRVEHGPAVDVTGQAITLAAWIKPDAGDWYGGIVHKGGQYGLAYFNGAVRFAFGNRPGVINGGGPGVVVGQWNHVAASYDGETIRFYVNGSPATETAVSGTVSSLATPLFLGCVSGDDEVSGQSCKPGEGFRGEVDEVGVWGRVLTLSEIQTQFRGPLVKEDGAGDACDACPQSADPTCAPRTCLDRDGDGYGVQGASACSAGRVAAFDCDETRPDVHPGAVEVCDGRDNDCDGQVDDACLSEPQVTKYKYNAFNQLLAAGRPVVCAPGDADCDGVADASDNCPAVYNPDQRDSDRVILENTNPAGLWRFEDPAGSTTVRDATNRNSGTLTGGATLGPGRAGGGQALVLDGSGAHVALPPAVTSSTHTGISIEAWVKSEATTGSFFRSIMSEILGADGNVEFGLFTNGPAHGLTAGFYDSGWQTADETTGGVGTGQWVHVAGTFDGTTVRAYRDGVMVAQTAVSAPLPQGDTGWAIGAGPGQAWHGMIDDVAIYERALTPTEVAQHRSGGDGLGDVCDPCVNNPDPACQPAACTDDDGDGFGVAGASACPGSGGRFDCDDSSAAVRPGAAEVMGDGIDNNCDGVVDAEIGLGTAFAYDGNGNQVRKVALDGTTGYVWDARDRLAEVKQGGLTVARYGYDTQNLRVYMNDSGGERRILLDGVEEYGEFAGAVQVARYDHDPSRIDVLLAQEAGAKTHAVTDALGSVYGLTTPTGAPQAKYGYDVYGTRTASLGAGTTPRGFTGRRHEPTGQMYYRSRYYEPSVGLFTSGDPLGPFAGLHGENSSLLPHPLQGYALNNPAGFSDPLGLFSVGDHYGITHSAALVTGLGPLTTRIIAESNVAIDANQPDDFKHGMRESSGWFSEFMSFFGKCYPPTSSQSPEPARIQAAQWISNNLERAKSSVCKGDVLAAAEYVGTALHTIQDRIAHRVPDGPTAGFPANMFEHCRFRMHTSDDPYLGANDVIASVETGFTVRWFWSEIRHSGQRSP